MCSQIATPEIILCCKSQTGHYFLIRGVCSLVDVFDSHSNEVFVCCENFPVIADLGYDKEVDAS